MIRRSFLVAFGFVLIALAIWGGVKAIVFLSATFVALRPEVAVAVLTAAGTVLTATGTIVLGRFFERQREVESHFRARKVEIYDEFLKEFFKVFFSNDKTKTEHLVAFLREWQRKMIVWGGAKVLVTFIAWKQHMQKGVPDAETLFKMGDLFLAMRDDLGLSNKGLSRQTFTHTLLKSSDLLLTMAKTNPAITLAALSELEKKLHDATQLAPTKQ